MRPPTILLSLTGLFMALATLHGQELPGPELKEKAEVQQAAASEILRLGGNLVSQRKPVVVGFVGNKFTSDKFALLSSLTDVSNLFFSHVPASDEGFKHCVRLAQLKDVFIESCKFSGTGFKHLAKCERLETLFIEDTPITDEGLFQIAKLSGLKKIVINNWCVKPKVTEKGLIELAKLKKLKSLGVTMVAVPEGLKERLEKALPECKIWLATYKPESRKRETNIVNAEVESRRFLILMLIAATR